MSDGRYELTIHNDGNARFDSTGVADGTRGFTRQTDHAWADVTVRSAGLYPVAGSSKQVAGITDVMHSAHPGLCHQSKQATSHLPFVDMGGLGPCTKLESLDRVEPN